MEMNEDTFEIIIDFDKSAKQPQRIFRTLSNIIEELNSFDKILCKTIPSEIKVDTMLEDVEKGSLKILLKQALKSVDDEALYEINLKKVFGRYLLKAKYILIKFLDDNKDDINNSTKLIQLREDIFELSNTTDTRVLPVYSKINTTDLVQSLNKFNNATCGLSDNDILKFGILDEKLEVKYNDKFSVEEFEDALTETNLVTENKMILKVKKPDYLGESKWELRHGKTTINAKITDIEWLKKFQNREFDIRPKDSLDCSVKITTNYDIDNELISVDYEVVNVEKVVNFKLATQKSLLDN